MKHILSVIPCICNRVKSVSAVGAEVGVLFYGGTALWAASEIGHRLPIISGWGQYIYASDP